MLSLVWKMSLTLTVTQNSFIRKGEELRPPDCPRWIQQWFNHEMPRTFERFIK